MDASPLQIVIYPWFSMEHLTPYLHFSNKLGKRGHKSSFFIPQKNTNQVTASQPPPTPYNFCP
ncbi:putative anthocyanidin 3-O-glucoside 2'''-O-xylosyltransferase [Lupinus albus]|uniref:Putative anthocyanidin 3-O-glucoside 2'''-O-xylosyltransferase n=1 Tax=Lupinus albus TaxID=3870 RepID=A0A6A4P6K7_LUPAL|nr:putative anthocyanidin 3-O-glucoside 2'''-O-xylosyltransferase [Lupinus albus]